MGIATPLITPLIQKNAQNWEGLGERTIDSLVWVSAFWKLAVQTYGFVEHSFTPLKTYGCPLKINGWKMTCPFKMVPFLGTCSFSGCTFISSTGFVTVLSLDIQIPREDRGLNPHSHLLRRKAFRCSKHQSSPGMTGGWLGCLGFHLILKI